MSSVGDWATGCGHVGLRSAVATCLHLGPAATGWVPTYHWYTGDVVSRAGVRGSPEVREELGPIDEPVVACPVGDLTSPLVDLSHAAAANRWFGLCADGTIVSLAPDWSAASPTFTVG